jgi:hypothetical protein
MPHETDNSIPETRRVVSREEIIACNVYPSFILDHGDNMYGWTSFLSKPGSIKQKAKELRRFPLKYRYGLLSYPILFCCSVFIPSYFCPILWQY